MSVTSTLRFSIVGDNTSAVSAMRGVSREAEKSTSRVKSQFKDLAKVGFAAALGGGLVEFGKASVNAASDLNETLSKSRVIFGDNAAAMEKWGSTASTSLGLSQQAALESAASFGDMFSQIGITQDAAAGMSKQVVQMAADFGSFNNLPTAEVLDMIAGGFRGEFDSLQRVIPNINAARVETEALSLAHKKNAKELTAAEKAQAVMNILQKDGKRAMGDFARTADGNANSTKILAAKVEDLQAKMGQMLLPAINGVVHITADYLVPALGTASQFAQQHATQIKILAGVVLSLWAAYRGFKLIQGAVGAISHATKAYQQWVAQLSYGGRAQRAASSGLQSVSGSAARVAGSLAVVGAAVAVGTMYWQQHQQQVAAAKQAVADMTQALEQDNGALGENTRALLAQKLASMDVFDAAQKVGLSIETVTAAAEGNEEAMRAVARATDGNFEAIQKVLDPIAAQNQALVKAKRNLDQTATATGGASRKQGEFTVASRGTTRVVQDQNKSLDALNKALNETSGKAIDAKQAELRLKDAFGDLSNKVKENGTTLSENTTEGRANKSMLLDLIQQVNSHAAAVGQQTGSANKAAVALDRDEKAMRAAAVAAGFNAREVNALIRKYAAVPRDVRTTVRANTGPAKAAIDDLRRYYQSLAHITLAVNTPQGRRNATALFDIRSNAQGTGFFDGVFTRINELGQEVARLPDGSVVFPGAQAASMFGGGGGGATVVNIHLTGVAVGTAEQIGRVLVGALEQAGHSGVRMNISKAIV